jgi:hypothetical protein
MPNQPRPKQSTQSWMTFVRNHSKSIIACDFFVVVTATFRLVYVFIVMEIGTRRILHLNVTTHPNAEWTMQQFRECLTGEERYRFVIHDRDAIYSKDVDLAEDDRTANSENTRAVTASQCFLRTAHRYHSTGMFGLYNSA